MEGIVDRIAFLNKRIKRMLEETLLEFGLNIGEWHVLSALWNSGEPFQSSPGHLAKRSELTTGAMTNRIDGLEAEGLVKRLPDPDDRRGVIVQLTPKGRELWERSVGCAGREGAVRGLGAERDRAEAAEQAAAPDGAARRAGCAGTCQDRLMPKGYAEGPAAEEAERRLEELELARANGQSEEAPEERLAVFGSTAAEPEKHFLGWRDDVDPEALFETGEAWGLTVSRRRAD